MSTGQLHVAALGTLSILNVGAGDLVIRFDTADEVELERARKMVEDMLRAGYALVVAEEDGTHSPVQAFDPARCEYIVADMDFRRAKGEARERRRPSGAKARTARRRIPARRARATAIAPSAGG